MILMGLAFGIIFPTGMVLGVRTASLASPFLSDRHIHV